MLAETTESEFCDFIGFKANGSVMMNQKTLLPSPNNTSYNIAHNEKFQASLRTAEAIHKSSFTKTILTKASLHKISDVNVL